MGVGVGGLHRSQSAPLPHEIHSINFPPSLPRPYIPSLSFAPQELPWNDYYEYFAPDFNLHVAPSATMENLNTRQYLETVRQQVRALIIKENRIAPYLLAATAIQ
jgi:hypothetical protein